MILLTDEEILNGLNSKSFNCIKHISLVEEYLEELRELNKAQLKKVVDEFLLPMQQDYESPELLDGLDPNKVCFIGRKCVWQAMLKEVEK